MTYYTVTYPDFTSFTFESTAEETGEFGRYFAGSKGFVTSSGAFYNTKNFINIQKLSSKPKDIMGGFSKIQHHIYNDMKDLIN